MAQMIFSRPKKVEYGKRIRSLWLLEVKEKFGKFLKSWNIRMINDKMNTKKETVEQILNDELIMLKVCSNWPRKTCWKEVEHSLQVEFFIKEFFF